MGAMAVARVADARPGHPTCSHVLATQPYPAQSSRPDVSAFRYIAIDISIGIWCGIVMGGMAMGGLAIGGMAMGGIGGIAIGFLRRKASCAPSVKMEPGLSPPAELLGFPPRKLTKHELKPGAANREGQ